MLHFNVGRGSERRVPGRGVRGSASAICRSGVRGSAFAVALRSGRRAAKLLVLCLGLAAAAVLVTTLTGCPRDACILKICEGKDCHCSLSSCNEGAAFDTRQNRCRCLKGFLPVAGQCLTQQAANAYCGVGHQWQMGGCVQSACRPGDELDQSTGLCIPREQVNKVGTNIGVNVGQGQQLGCPAGTKLVIDGPTAACVPLAQTCARDETWTGQSCAKIVQCPTGSIWDTAVRQCVQYTQGSGGDEVTVNVAQWANSNYGPNGGAGASSFCGAFAKKPWSFGVSEGNSAFVRIAVMLSFPGGDITKAAVQTSSVFDGSRNPVPAKGAGEVEAAARSILGPLVQGGGRASAPSATTTVKCAVINAAKPQPVPATGGL